MVQSGQDAVLPLYLINPLDKGGFEFDQTDIGWIYTGIGPIELMYTPLIFPQIAKLMDYTSIYSWTGIIYSFILLIYPVTSLFNTYSMPVCFFSENDCI